VSRDSHERLNRVDLDLYKCGPDATPYVPWDAAQARAGRHPAAMQFLAERRVALLGSDGNDDTEPSVVADDRRRGPGQPA
jgi:hypothetical protein